MRLCIAMSAICGCVCSGAVACVYVCEVNASHTCLWDVSQLAEQSEGDQQWKDAFNAGYSRSLSQWSTTLGGVDVPLIVIHQ